ncbi:hypothetical protein PROFUN_14413 [Planoprotostelium fungivorum]|uniref:Uncharacterized protein n=1 Tax=Planoprotostelium fungivorum TaxID=1890364 RepID=A0A2P6MX82_9EUKA|nr:hypothetical protein PROFUN_14413 [Planoprotostelium fungivorum]
MARRDRDRDKQFFVETDPKNARQDRDTNFYVSAGPYCRKTDLSCLLSYLLIETAKIEEANELNYRSTIDLINWTKLRSTITAFIWSPVEVLETLQRKIWRIKIETHRERGTKQTTLEKLEQRPEKKPDLLNIDGDDVTRAVAYWMTPFATQPAGLPDRKDMETRDKRFEDDTDRDEKVQDEAVRGDEENPLWQSALMRISWRKRRKREFVVSPNTQANNNNMPKKGRRTTTTTTPSEPDNNCGWG